MNFWADVAFSPTSSGNVKPGIDSGTSRSVGSRGFGFSALTEGTQSNQPVKFCRVCAGGPCGLLFRRFACDCAGNAGHNGVWSSGSAVGELNGIEQGPVRAARAVAVTAGGNVWSHCSRHTPCAVTAIGAGGIRSVLVTDKRRTAHAVRHAHHRECACYQRDERCGRSATVELPDGVARWNRWNVRTGRAHRLALLVCTKHSFVSELPVHRGRCRACGRASCWCGSRLS